MIGPSIQFLNLGMIMNCSFNNLHPSPNPVLVFQNTSRIPAFFTIFATIITIAFLSSLLSVLPASTFDPIQSILQTVARVTHYKPFITSNDFQSHNENRSYKELCGLPTSFYCPSDLVSYCYPVSLLQSNPPVHPAVHSTFQEEFFYAEGSFPTHLRGILLMSFTCHRKCQSSRVDFLTSTGIS